MEQRLTDVLLGKGGNYIFPFFWQHGEDEATLREYMGAIHDCGIGAVCVECRPHPDFSGPQWWHDLDIIIDEAKKRDMRVWVLDDAHFPTGQANGAMADVPDELCKQFINFNSSDVCGPMPQAQLNIKGMAKFSPNPFAGGGGFPGRQQQAPRVFTDDALMKVVAYQINGVELIADTMVDITDCVQDGILCWDVPPGMWRIFVIYKTRNGGGRQHYINVVHYPSCRVQIDAVYEPHYQRYKDDFGKTLVGFFSDEPEIGNVGGFYSFDNAIGKKMPLPWSPEVESSLIQQLGESYGNLLPALWFGSTDPAFAAHVRYAFMNIITRLVEKDFSNQIGGWCEAHGVEYIGHTIEDNNQHARLGSSFGHQFRGLSGQHMAGIDDIGNQVLLGGEDHDRLFMGEPRGDGEFFHFALGKLGSSQGHLDPKKLGRTMCEIYGAYGWGAGVRLMKYLTDHFVVRGVNQFVPHAFSPKAFPDPDCPPHFYAHGKNPQYRHFASLMRYLNRLCHLFNNGRHIAPAAVLYHAEAEWTGEYMFLQKPARVLLENQIDFDIISSDMFEEADRFKTVLDGTLKINNEEFGAVVVPYAQFITSDFAKFAIQAIQKGFPIVFIDKLPQGICDGDDPELIAQLQNADVTTLDKLAEYLRKRNVPEIQVQPAFRRLRYYHYKQANDIFMFTNEDPSVAFEGDIELPVTGEAVIYDAYENVLRPLDATSTQNGTRIHLRLEGYESVIVVFGGMEGMATVAKPQIWKKAMKLSGEWTLSLAEALEYPNFRDEEKISELRSIGLLHPDFSGFMRYETTFDMAETENVTLELEDAYEGVEVWVNEKYVGMSICPPYRYDIGKFVKPGKNQLRIEVANTLQRAVNAMPSNSPYMMMFTGGLITPSGIIGDVTVYSE